MSASIILTPETFDEFLNSQEVPTLVDFWAPWCGPCRAISPILDEIASSGLIQVAKFNIDEDRSIASRYNIMGIPAMLVFEGGEVTKRLAGAKPKEAIIAELGL